MSGATVKLFTLIFVKNTNNEVLLGYKTRGLGVGLWNGFGGKVEKEESLLKCAQRELYEECQIKAKVLTHVGVIRYEVEDERQVSLVHVFTCSKFTGKEEASEEMNPVRWYKLQTIPYDKMWPDAHTWIPLMLKNKIFSVHCVYSQNGEIQRSDVKEYESLNKALAMVNF